MFRGKSAIDDQNLYRILTERSFAGIYVVQDGKFVYLNTNAASYAGYRPEELIGMKADMLLHPEEQTRAKQLAREMLTGQRTDPYEFRIITKSGQQRWIMETVTPFLWEGRRAVLGNSMDITVKMEMEKALAEREEYFHVLFESLAEGVFVMEEDRFLRCNRMVLAMFRCTEAEIVGHTPYEFSPPCQPDGTPSPEKALRYIAAAAAGTPQFFPWVHRRADGSDFDAEVSLTALEMKGTTHLIAIVRDVSERRAMERALAESEARFRYVVERTPDLIFIVDRRGYFTYANPRFATVIGYRPDELIGKPFTMVIAPESLTAVIEHFRKGIRGVESPPYEAELLHQDGWRIPVEFLTTTIYDGQGKPQGRFGIGRDITERRLAEKRLRESQRLFADILNFSPDATFAIDRQGRVTAWNRAMEEMTGVKAVEMLGKGDYEYAIPIYGHRRPMLVDLVLTNQKAIRGLYDIISAEGGVIIAEVTVPRLETGEDRILWVKAAPIVDDEGQVTGAIETIRDITKQRREAEALKASEERFRAIFDDHVIGMYQSTPAGRFLRVNRAMARMCGYDSPEQMVTEITDIASQHYFDPEDRVRFLSAIEKTGHVEPVSYTHL
ncbi:MAG: PAS domain S-box protein, partial [Syntrophales bacterium]|nr:PAS domain S-box protein [Syntrophales bacterium]